MITLEKIMLWFGYVPIRLVIEAIDQIEGQDALRAALGLSIFGRHYPDIAHREWIKKISSGEFWKGFWGR